LQRTEAERDALRADFERERSALASLREEMTSVRASANERDAALKERQQAIESLEHTISKSEAELQDERARFRELSSRFDKEEAERHKIDVERDSLAAEAKQLRSEVRELRAAATDYTELEKTYARALGQVTSQGMAIEELRQQLAKTEGYADTLRDKLQRQIADAETQTSKARRLEENAAGASAKIDELAAELERERQEKSELGANLDKARKGFEEEIRKIRLELDGARETIANNQNLNQRLSADLADSTDHRRTLEAKLGESDEQHRSALQRLTDEVARLKLQLEDYEQKLAHKDAALKALLAEFASKPKDRATTGERTAADRDADEIVTRLPGRKSGGDDGGGADRDRVTRLLVGTIDGQKLRFPLFKDKLSIGRTAHNDIQIKAQYISRRHAMVVTEDDKTRIVDWGSKNGIYVNGIRVTEKALRNGDLVTVGTAEFVFEERPKR
jgi:chromosome segregation ATPase